MFNQKCTNQNSMKQRNTHKNALLQKGSENWIKILHYSEATTEIVWRLIIFNKIWFLILNAWIVQESGFSRNRQNRGFLPKSRIRYPTNYYDPPKRTTTTSKTSTTNYQLDRFSFQSFYPSSAKSHHHGLRSGLRPIRQERAQYPRPSPKPRATRRSKNIQPPKCKGASKTPMSCYKNIYQHG